MQEIRASVFFASPPAQVFAALADHETFFSGPHYSCRLTRDGQFARNGVGALREVRTGDYVFVEEIVVFDPPRGFDYLVRSVSKTSGRRLPLQHQRGWLELVPDRGGTLVHWRSRFAIAIPLLGWFLEPAFARTATRSFEKLLLAARARLDASPAAASDRQAS